MMNYAISFLNEFHSDYIRIFIPCSKKNVYREGDYVFIQ